MSPCDSLQRAKDGVNHSKHALRVRTTHMFLYLFDGVPDDDYDYNEYYYSHIMVLLS